MRLQLPLKEALRASVALSDREQKMLAVIRDLLTLCNPDVFVLPRTRAWALRNARNVVSTIETGATK